MALAASSGLTQGAASAASELMARGRASAAALEALLQGAPAMAPAAPALAPPHGDSMRELAAQILRCYDRALAALHGEGAVVDADWTSGCRSRKRGWPPAGAAGAADADQTRPKRRARANGAEMATKVERRTSPEDGFLWRKYGQKDIQNSKYPRTYFRCAYKHDNGCTATRQVQQSEDDPSLYVVTYFGEHTCGMDSAAAVGDDNVRQLVIDFGSSTASSGAPWPSSSNADDARSEASQLSEGVRSPQEEEEKLCKVEPTPTPTPTPTPAAAAAGTSTSADVPCASMELESLLRSFDWDFYFDQTAMVQ
ncbi:hypothetical protein ACP4OV_028781 [Aristida adscensionis]